MLAGIVLTPRRAFEGDLDTRAGPDVAAHGDIGAMTLYDAVDDVQTKPGTLAGLLGREKWLEDACLHVRRHTVSVVLDDQDGAGGRVVSDPTFQLCEELELASVWHRVARIHA